MLRKLFALLDVTLLPRVIAGQRVLLLQMTRRKIEERYRGAFLGLVWSFIQPLITLCIYTFVFSWLMGAKWGVEGTDWGLGIANSKTAFAMIMLCGMTAFNIFSESVNCSCNAIVYCPNYVKRVIFPLEILPISQVLSSFILGLTWVVILFVGTIFLFGRISWTMMWLPVVYLPLLCLSLGLSFVVAALGVYLRDTAQGVGIFTQFLFWAVPIVYPMKMLGDRIAEVPGTMATVLLYAVKWNPLTVVVEQSRRVFLFGLQPEWLPLGIVFVASLVVMQVGFFFFYRTKRGFADVL